MRTGDRRDREIITVTALAAVQVVFLMSTTPSRRTHRGHTGSRLASKRDEVSGGSFGDRNVTLAGGSMVFARNSCTIVIALMTEGLS
jgi:hypothetical protein